MSKQRIPTSERLWQRHVDLVLNVLFLALLRLREKNDLPLEEEDLDPHLYLSARNVYHGLCGAERPQGFSLVPKSENPPLEAGDLGQEWLKKRPDFKWQIYNDQAAKPEELTMDFDIECKRLGKPTSPTWVLTEQYVSHGIVRFMSESHRYGNNVSDGAMIGYVQDWDVGEILAEVNQHSQAQTKHTMPPLNFGELLGQSVMTARQSLTRTEVAPCAFCLHHLWVDLRSACASPSRSGQ